MVLCFKEDEGNLPVWLHNLVFFLIIEKKFLWSNEFFCFSELVAKEEALPSALPIHFCL